MEKPKADACRIIRGYVRILKLNHYYCKNGWVLEHRVVVEDYIKRALDRKEVVHHLDENKTNNKIENLMIFKNQKEHMKWHIKLKKFSYLTNPMKREIETRWEKYLN